ncbi:MAG: right-handed parallel beta-helix repeat-containing protein [Clostridia bacterium]|nr:right-handed parallel beta-helix repeat-containing protein [Clostridia bacterium]
MIPNSPPLDATAKLQALLDRCGIVTLDTPGEYFIHKTLIIHSNTRLVLAPGVRLIAAPLSRCALLQNEHFADGGHDENIEIEGGIWDGNCDEMGMDGEYEATHRLDHPYSPDLFKGKLIRFAHVDRLSLSKMTVRNPVSYGIQIADACGYVVRDIFFDYNWHFGTTDGVHINGPSYNGLIENLSGTTNDDMIGVTTYDEEHAEVTKGDIKNLVMRNISAHNGYSGVRLLSGEGFVMENVRIDGLYGTYRHHAVIISNHNRRPGRVWFDNLVIEHVYASKSATPLGEGCFRMWEDDADKCVFLSFDKGAICGNVLIRDVSRHQAQSTESPLLGLGKDCSINRLVLDNIHQTTAESATAPLWQINGTVHTLIQRDVIQE